ncbi:MAG TPA: energy transducer TonB [Rhizomicrobium sp.]|nr:energy transducer TonB [Rhizomicrobium sp.]
MATNLLRGRVQAVLFSAAAAAGVLASGSAVAVDTTPRVDMTQPRPQQYPDAAQLNGEEGAVLVKVFVRPNGRVGKYRIAQTSGFPDLDTAALESVLNWRFIPATHDGDVVSDWTTVRVVYQLPRAPAQPARPPG